MNKKQLKIIKSEVDSIDLTKLSELSTVDWPDFSKAGIEVYKFYAYLSTLVDNALIMEIGTRYGKSALALSFNPKNKVISYDILEQGASQIVKDNLEFRISNFMEDVTIDWNLVDILLINVDPHDGIKDREFLTFLREKGW